MAEPEVAFAVRWEWMRMPLTLAEFAYADFLLGRLSPEQEASPPHLARSLLEGVPRWLSTVGRLLERFGPTLVVASVISWQAPGFAGHPGYLGLGGLITLVVMWLLSGVLLETRSPRLAWVGFVLVFTVPGIVALELPGPDIGIPLFPVWLILPFGFLAGCSYLFRLVCTVEPSRLGITTLETLWRASGTSEGAIGEMSEEVADLAGSREDQGRPLREEDWMSEGLVVDYPEAADPHRHWRLLLIMFAVGVGLVSLAVVFDFLTSDAAVGRVDGPAVRMACLIVALVALPGVVLLRRGRWLLLAALAASLLAAVLVPEDVVLVEVDPFWAVGSLFAVVIVVVVRRPRRVRELLDRLL